MAEGIDDRELSIPTYSPVCTYCRHLRAYGLGRKCRAFDEIPLEIWTGKHNHKTAYSGDNGVIFEPVG